MSLRQSFEQALGLVVVGLLAAWCQVAPAANAAPDLRDALAVKFGQIKPPNRVQAHGVELAAVGLIAEIYANNAFQPLWSEQSRIAQLAEIDRAAEDGLDPQDYHGEMLETLVAEASANSDPEFLSDLDALLTDSFIRLAYHLHFGKADPERLDRAWNFSRSLGSADPARKLGEAVRAGASPSCWRRRDRTACSTGA